MSNDLRIGRHVVYNLHVHLVFVAKYRKKVFTKEILDDMQVIFEKVCSKFEAQLVEFDGESDHVHLLVVYPPKVAISSLVNSLKGAYATLGNHDMYGHEGEIRDAIQKANITLLADDKVLVDNQFWLVGRLDNHASYRKATKDLMPSSTDKPIILLDHQPNEIEQNVQLPIDLQVSGHTHNGQIFPANFIVKFLNRLGYGYERINNTDVIVSSGYGFWGVPFRLGSQAELWVIDLVGKKS